MRTAQWIVVLALLAQAFAAVTDRPDEDAEKLYDLHEENITKEYTLEELLTDSNYTEIEALLAMENGETTTNFEFDAGTEKPSEEDQLEFHNGTDPNSRILGGTAVETDTFAQYNYHVLVVSKTAADIERWFCGGTLLSGTWALTAAHCVVLVSTINVYYGTHSDPLATTPKTATAYIHPGFRLNLMINDIALLKMSTPLTLSGTIGIARLSLVKPTVALDNVALTTMGFGPKTDAQSLATTGTTPLTLNVVEVTNVKKSTCNANTIDVYVSYPGNTGCLGTSSGTKGICFGDEGGPVLYTSSSESTAKIIGVNSQSREDDQLKSVAAAGSTMRTSRRIVVLALLAQAIAAVTDRPDEDAEKLGNLHEENITKEYTLEELLTDSNYTEIEALLAKENGESTTNFEVDAATEKPSEEDRLEFHNGTDPSIRILGGTAVTSDTFAQYNYHVLVVGTTGADITRRICGGALLSATWALTAAHCVVLTSKITVYPGKFSDPFAAAPTIATATIHPGFINFLTNDIALLKMSSPLTLSGTIGVARLSLVKPSAALDNAALTIMGFGPETDGTGLPMPLTLNVVELTNVKKSKCNADLSTVYLNFPVNTGCLGTSSATKGLCFIDEGGPVLYKSSSEPTAKIIGVGSQSLGCPSDYPSSFTWIYPYIGWITTTTRRNFT
ncbi:Hypothetical predicted protein [Cloeon dipterum]|uniref:Peptidase S1 domain-containing protein n=1 Tax=Cloeon dipterum TaxID=197152 RepID=A0A8S1DFC4_9INSE|nr:Hypothetical predicted protein [Cloeon dipterum]